MLLLTFRELSTALREAIRRPSLRREVAQIVHGAARAGDRLPAEAFEECVAAPDDPSRLAELVDAMSARAPLMSAMTRVVREWPEAALILGSDAAAASRNDVAGSFVGGSLVQAREIHGDVYLRSTGREVPVPRQLLPAPAFFVDREADLAALEDLRGQHPRTSPLTVVLTGPAGVGKTALASRWLGALTGIFPDGQLYADLRGFSLGAADKPGDVLGQFIHALGCDQVPAHFAEKAALWRSLTAGRRVAVMLDNALSAAQVRPLLPSAEGCLVAVVSRRRLPGLGVDGAVFHHLGVMESDAAVDLLRSRIGDRRVEREPDSARRVTALCGGLPLAVCVAAARMAAKPQQSVAAMAGAMDRGVRRFETLRLEGEHVVESALDETYRVLAPDVARCYRILGVLPVDTFEAAVASAGCAVALQEAEALLEELVEANLVEEMGPGLEGPARYRLHDLIRLHAAKRSAGEDGHPAEAESVRRVMEWYLRTASEARHLLAPSHRVLRRDYLFAPPWIPAFADAEAALSWMNREGPHLMRVLRAASRRGWDAMCWELADAMQPWFLRSRPYDLWIEAHERGLVAARRAGHSEGVSRMLTTGGSGLYNAGRLDEAISWFTEALEDARARDDRRAEAQALHGLGQSHRLAGRLDRAAVLFKRALRLRETIGYRRGIALSRLCLGDVALDAGRVDEARLYLARAHAELVAEQDEYDAARALAFLGHAHGHASVRDHGTAQRLLGEALDAFRRTGSVHWQARVLEWLGQSAAGSGHGAAAREFYQASLSLYEAVSPTDARRLTARLAGPASPEDEL